MKGVGNVSARRHLSHHKHVSTTASQLECSISHGFRRFGTASHKKPRFRVGGSQDLHRTLKRALVIGKRNDGDSETNRPAVPGLVDRREILDPVEPGIESKGQGARILTIDTTGCEPTPPANRLALLISEQTPRGVIDMLKDALMVQDNDGLAKLVENFVPRPVQRFSRMSYHTFLTVG